MSLSYEFPGAKTPWRTVDRAVPMGMDSPYEGQANEEARDIAAKVTALRAQATALSAKAEKFLAECRQFTIPPNAINYVQPNYSSAGFHVLDGLKAPQLRPSETFDISTALIESDFNAAFNASPALSLPEKTDIKLPPLPTTSFNGAKPASPPEFDISVSVLPRFAYVGRPVPIPAPVQPFAPPSINYEVQVPETVNVPELSTEEIDAALSKVRSIINERTSFSMYGEIDRSIFSYVSYLLASPSFFRETINATTVRHEAFSDSIGSTLSTAYSRRNIDSLIDFSSWIQKENGYDKEKEMASNAAALGRWTNDALLVAYRSAEKAHSQAMELYGLALSAEVDALISDAEAQLLWLEAVSLAYEGAKASFETAALNAETEYVRALANVNQYEAEAASTRGEVSKYIADAKAYVATQRSKTVQSEIASSLVDTEKAKAEAFDAETRVLRAKAEALEAKFLKFKTEVATWSAGAAQVQATWKEYSAKAAAVAAENRAKATSVQIANLPNTVIASKTRLLAAEAKKGISDFLVKSAKRRATLNEVSLKNEAVQKTIEAQLAQYRAEVELVNLPTLSERIRLDGVATELSAASKYFVHAMEAAARAAEQAHSTNIQLAEAYNLVQKAAGEGAAAIEAGRLSSLRAGVSVSAAGGISASGTATLSLSREYSHTTSEEQSASESIEV